MTDYPRWWLWYLWQMLAADCYVNRPHAWIMRMTRLEWSRERTA